MLDTMTWFYLALIAPLLFAVVNLIDDNLIHHVYKGPYFGAIISGLFGALPLVSLLFLDLAHVTPLVAILGTMAGYFTVLYLYFYFRALEVESPSVVIALMSLSLAIIPIFAYFFLGERLHVTQMAGFMVVLLASVGLATTGIRHFKFTPALLPVLAAALVSDAAVLISKHVYQSTDFYTGYMYFSIGMGIGALYFLYVLQFLQAEDIIKDLKRNSKKVITLLVIAEFIAIVAEFAQNLAISQGPVSLVTVLEGVQPLYVLLIALIFYKVSPKHFREAAEGKIAKKVTLMLVMFVGLLLISLGS